MECSICYDAITKDTGKAELSCSHTFHLKCLSQWFLKNENCPCCRHEAKDMERMVLGSGSRSATLIVDDDDDDSDSDSDSYDEEDDLDLAAAQERARHRMNTLKSKMTKEQLEAYAASRIAALVRGYQSRMFFFEFKCVNADLEDSVQELKEAQNKMDDCKKRKKFYHKLIPMSRPQIRTFAATKIQGIWRTRKQQQQYKKEIWAIKLLRSMKSFITINGQPAIDLETIRSLQETLTVELKLQGDNTWERFCDVVTDKN